MPRLVLIALAFGLGVGLLYLIFVKELPRTEEQAGGIAQQTIEMTGVVVKQQRGDAVEWIVTSDRAVYNETLKQVELLPVHFQVMTTGGSNPQPANLDGTADSAFLDQQSGRVALRGSTHIVKDKELELRSDELEYTHGTGLIKATGHVEVTQGNAVMEADSAEYVIGTGKFKMMAPSLFQ